MLRPVDRPKPQKYTLKVVPDWTVCTQCGGELGCPKFWVTETPIRDYVMNEGPLCSQKCGEEWIKEKERRHG